MKIIMFIVIIYTVYIQSKYDKLKEENKINYNNYMTTLKSLAEYDSTLKDYLIKEGKLK